MSCCGRLPLAEPVSNGVHTTARALVRLKVDAQHIGPNADHSLRSVWTGRRRSRLRGRGLDFDEIRHYRPGDDVRHMDWRVTRRTGQPFVRVYNEERDRPVLIAVDQRLTMFFGSRRQMKSVTAAEAAALLAWSSLSGGDRIGWLLMGQARLVHARASRRPEALLTQIEALATMNHALAHLVNDAPGDHPTAVTPTLENTLKAATRSLNHDGLLIVVSDFADWNAQCLNHLRNLRRHNEALCLRISDPLERALDGAERLVAGDGHWQLALTSPPEHVRQRYRTSWDTAATALSDDLRRTGVPLIDVDCAKPTVAQLQRHLGRRGPAS